MSWLTDIFWRKPKLAYSDGELRGKTSSWAGRSVGPAGALQIAAWWACVRLIAETVATLPIGLFERKADGSRASASGHPLYGLLHDSPNADQTAVEFWEGLVLQLCTYGNAYALKHVRDGGGLISLEPLSAAPGAMVVTRSESGVLRYRFVLRGKTMDVGEDRMFHIRGFGDGGDLGLSVVGFARQTLGLAEAIAHSAGATFKNGMKASVFFTQPPGQKAMTTDQRKDFKETFIDPYVGAEANTAAGLLEHGFDVKTVSLPPRDAEMLMSWRFSVEEICRWFRVPPVLIGHSAQGQTMWGSGIEQIMLGWLTLGLRPYLTRIEQAIKKRLIAPADRGRFYAEFNVEGLMRADSAGRAALLSALGQNGYITRNEGRALDNRPPMDGGDELTVQSNMIRLRDLGKADATGGEQQLRPAFVNLLFGGDVEQLIDQRVRALVGHNGGPPLDEE